VLSTDRSSATPAALPTATVLSQYPLSKSYAAEVAALVGGRPQFLTLTKLRELSLPGMLSQLRRLPAGPLAIALEDPTSAGGLPILKLVASASSAGALSVIDSELRRARFGRLGQVAGSARFAGACLDGQRALRRSTALLAALAREPRVEVQLDPARRHVAYLNTNLWFGAKAGGSVGHISGVANALMEHGYGLDYLTVGGRLMLKPKARHMELTPPAIFGLPFEANLYRFDHSFGAQASTHIDGARTSFLYQRLSVCNFSGVRLSRAKRLPLVVEYNGSEVWVAANWGRGLRYPGPAEAAEAQTLRHAHVVVTISDVLRDELLERGVEPERLVTYPNCIDPATFDPARFGEPERVALRSREDLPADACVATFVGTFGAWHGAEVYAEAIRELCTNQRDAVEATRLRFLFVGDGVRMPAVRAILNDAACMPYVRFAGLVPQPDAPAYLAASDILVSPHVPNADGTRFFGSPTKLFEYLAMGKAIIASDLDQVGDVLRNSIGLSEADVDTARVAQQGRLAVLLPPGDAGALARGLLMLARQPQLRAALGENARREALAKYTWRQHVDAILERVRAVAGGKPR
jgi:glycosyltransferase involved in cell wall biosynthesis